MQNKLYVGNLPFSTSEDALKTFFEQVGAVNSVRLITDRETGRSKGFAFVEMSNEDDANAAISELDGNEYEGRPLRISIARERAPGTGGGGGGDRGGPRRSFGGGGGDRDRGGSGGGGRRERY